MRTTANLEIAWDIMALLRYFVSLREFARTFRNFKNVKETELEILKICCGLADDIK